MNMTISWDMLHKGSSVSGFELEISAFYDHKNWRQYFRIASDEKAKIVDNQSTRFHYNCMAGKFASSENDLNKYHVRIYSLVRHQSIERDDPHEGVLIRVLKPPWPGESALWSPQIIAVTNQSCDSLVRTEFTLAPLDFRFTEYAVCLKSMMGGRACMKRLNISPANRTGSAWFVMNNVTAGMYKVLIKANHREFGADCRCKKSEPPTTRTVCSESGCQYTASAEFLIHHPSNELCLPTTYYETHYSEIIYIMAGCMFSIVTLMCMILFHIRRRNNHIIDSNLNNDLDVELLSRSISEDSCSIHQLAGGTAIAGRYIAVLHTRDSCHHDTIVLRLTELLTRFSDSTGLVDCRTDDNQLSTNQIEYLIRELNSAYAVIIVASKDAYDKAALLADGCRGVFMAAMHTVCTQSIQKMCVVSFHYTPYDRVSLFDDSIPHFRIMDELDRLTSWLDPNCNDISVDDSAALTDALESMNDTV